MKHRSFGVLYNSPEDLDSCILRLSIALDQTSAEDPSKPDRLNRLAISLNTRFCRSGRRKDIDAEVSYSMQAVELAPQGHPESVRYVVNLAQAHKLCFKHFGEVDDVDARIMNMELALPLPSYKGTDKANLVDDLVAAHRSRFARIRNLLIWMPPYAI